MNVKSSFYADFYWTSRTDTQSMNKYHLCLVSVFFIACIQFFFKINAHEGICLWNVIFFYCFWLCTMTFMTIDLKSSSSAFSNQLQVINGSFSFVLFFPSPSFGDLKLMVKQKGFLYCWNCLKWRVGWAKFQKVKVFCVAALRTKKRRTFQIDLLSRARLIYQPADIYRTILAIFRCIGISICNSQ